MTTLLKRCILAAALLLGMNSLHAADGGHRGTVLFDRDWKFHLGNEDNAQDPAYNDAAWRKLDLPHDWSIEGSFSKDAPATTGGGALPGGIGWYRKTFTVPVADQGKSIAIDFDGVYMNSEVWINGHFLGKRPYGYSSFEYLVTPYLHYGATPNVIAVKVNNDQQPNSRWYSGSGIYRHVWLTTAPKVHVDHWGTHIATPEVSAQQATVVMHTILRNEEDQAKTVSLTTTLLDQSDKPVAAKTQQQQVPAGDSVMVSTTFTVKAPQLWSVDRPYRYTAQSVVTAAGQSADTYKTPFGIRYFNFDVNKGFSLNGKPLKILGVCNHHDLGSLGAAVNDRALQRQLELLKDMGCNAIRTSHNPPAPELLDLCDKMGFIVMDESFDIWKHAKTPYDYHLYWDEWHARDLQDMLRRDRNHPSIMIWSVGNEVWEQGEDNGPGIIRELRALVRAMDTTRPISTANNGVNKGNKLINSGALDLTGTNYHESMLDTIQQMFPGKPYIGTENTSALETRGFYDMPADSIRRWPLDKGAPGHMNEDLTCSAYDNVSAPWGATHEEAWKVIKRHDYMSGMFIWTGFDYLGEPTPYDWPAHSSYFGIIDLAGIPKDVYYMYQSEWTHKTVLHLLPHWNWAGRDSVDVWAYYSNADAVELYVNGHSAGVRSKKGDELHVSWKVAYQPGELKAVSRKDGKVVRTEVIRTAGAPAKLVLAADRSKLQASGTDLSFVTVRVEDKDGNLVPDADNLVHFSLTNNGFLAGVDNGNPVSLEPFKASERKAFHGKCMAIVQAKPQAGKITLTATAEGLAPASVSLDVR